MPYKSLKDAPPGLKTVAAKSGGKPIVLTLAQVNDLTEMYDAVKGKSGIDNPAGVAKATFRKKYIVKDGKWVLRQKKEEEEAMLEQKGEGKAGLGVGGTDLCVCPECGYETKHERGKPCIKMVCPECGAKMAGKGMPQSARKKEEVINMDAITEKMEAEGIAGGMRQKLRDLEDTLRSAAVKSGQFGEVKEDDYDLSIMDIVDSTVYFQNYKENKYYQATYSITDDIVEFSDVKEVEMMTTPVPVSEEYPEGKKIDFKAFPKKPSKVETDPGNDPTKMDGHKPTRKEEFVMEEKVSTSGNGHEYVLSGEILLEEASEKGPLDVFSAKGTVPLIKENVYTANNNRYTTECVDWLEVDIKRLLESASSGKVLDMYPTHAPVTHPESNNPLTSKAGRITGLLRDGDIASIQFETIPTNDGKDVAVLLNQGMVKGVSLRALPMKFEQNEKGGDDVHRMKLFGSDFTDRVGMQYEKTDNAQFNLEEGEEMTIEEIKANKELYGKLQEEFKTESKESEEQKDIDVKLKAGSDAQKKLEEYQKAEKRSELLEQAKEILKKDEVLTDTLRALIKERIDTKVDGFLKEEDPKAAMEKCLVEETEAVKRQVAEIRKEVIESQFANVSVLSPGDRRLGLLKEETGGSAKLSDILAAKVLQKPVFKDGVSIFEEFNWLLDPILEMEQHYLGKEATVEEALHQHGALGALLLEAGEQKTSTTVPGGLPYEVAEAVIKAAFPALIATKICRVGTMKSKTKHFWERTYRRYDDHKFGSLAQGGSFSATGDAGAITYAQACYVKVITAVDTNTTITVTGKDQNGSTMTGTVVVKTTHSADDYIEITPTNVGDRWTDISGATATGWTSAGEVNFITEKAIQGYEATAYAKARSTLTEITATATAHELGSALSNDVIEDMRMAMKDVGGGYDVLADLVSLIAQDIEEFIDRKILHDATDGATGATDTFAQATVPAGYTQKEWNETVEKSINDLIGKVDYNSNVGPNWMVINTMDRGRFIYWLGERLFKYNVSRDDAFQGSRAIGNVGGCEVYVSPEARRSKWLVGSNQVGLHYLIYVAMQLLGPQWDPITNTQAILRRQRSAIKLTQPKTLGVLTIS